MLRPVKVQTRWPDIGISHAGAIRDLLRQKDLDDPQLLERYRTVLPPHGTVLLRLK